MPPLLLQGVYYTITGIWPILSIGTFIKVTGPKTDIWLVKTVGLLIFVSGVGMVLSYLTRSASIGILAIAIGEAFFLMLIDIVYALHGTISKIYLADAVVEAGLILWILLSV